jgi:EmrB/QacA subfamily drug resistance transporter
VSTAYTLTLAGLLLLGGTLGDRYGRRRVFVVGVVWFGIASALCGVAPDATTLILARGLQGIGAALLTPGSLAILQASFAEDDRGRAIGAWSGLGGVATAIGPFVGGWLIAAVSWRLVFFLNLPLTVAVVLIAARHVPESRAPGPHGALDVAGAVVVTGGLTGLAYGLIEGPVRGWTTPSILACLAAGVVLLACVVPIERRAAEPLLPLGLFRARTVAVSTTASLLIGAVLFGVTIYVPVYTQEVLHASATGSGVILIPLTLGWVVASMVSGQLVSRTGRYRIYPLIGSVLVLAGTLLLTRLDRDSSRAAVSAYLVVIGLGMGTMFQIFVIATQNRVDFRELGVATAAIQFFRSMGGSVAVAALGALLVAKGADIGAGTHAVFVAIVPLAALIVALAIVLPEHPLRTSAPATEGA